MPHKRPTTVRLQQMVRAYRQSAALMAAIELGLFTRVSEGAQDRTAVARSLGISELNADRLVTYCPGTGLLEQVDGRLRNAPDVERFLVEDEKGYVGAWMVFSKPDWNDWGMLARHLRSTDDPVILGMRRRCRSRTKRRPDCAGQHPPTGQHLRADCPLNATSVMPAPV
jgi:hypothetical protein